MKVSRWLRTLSSRDERVATVSLAAAACGALATVPVSTPLRGVVLLAFVLTGVGSAVMCWIDLPAAVTMAAVVGISIAALTAVAVVMAWLEFWYPVPSCLIVAALAALSGAIRLRTLRDPATEADPTW